mmetsp:Transcript_33389/g.44536  ORF Transcript_33389/g.44536 Transcript_33389/m.44536 type:complete len:111 (-) Transcript_33389:531-863(-)
MLDGNGVHIKARNAHAFKLIGLLSVGDGEAQVIVQVVLVLFEPCVIGGRSESNREATHGVVELLAAHKYGQTVQGEVHLVLTFHEFAHPAELLAANGDLAQWCAAFTGLH